MLNSIKLIACSSYWLTIKVVYGYRYKVSKQSTRQTISKWDNFYSIQHSAELTCNCYLPNISLPISSRLVFKLKFISWNRARFQLGPFIQLAMPTLNLYILKLWSQNVVSAIWLLPSNIWRLESECYMRRSWLRFPAVAIKQRIFIK